MEIVPLVEGSALLVKRTLQELGVARSSYYEWYQCYQRYGYEGLEGHRSQPEQLWKEIPTEVR